MAIQGILFDMDGVLLDSENLTSEAAILYFRKKGFDVKHEDFLPFFGTGEKGYFGGVAEKYGIPYVNETDAPLIYKIYESLARDVISPLPGVESFLRECRKRNLKLAVATSANRIKMEINLSLLGFSNAFDAYICGSDIRNNKPHPEIFLKAAENLGLSPEECLVVEDAPSGVEAARRAGCRCLALLTTFGASDLQNAHWISRNLANYPPEIFF